MLHAFAEKTSGKEDEEGNRTNESGQVFTRERKQEGFLGCFAEKEGERSESNRLTTATAATEDHQIWCQN